MLKKLDLEQVIAVPEFLTYYNEISTSKRNRLAARGKIYVDNLALRDF